MGYLIAKERTVDALMQTKLSRRQLIKLTLAGTVALQASSHAFAQTAGSRASGGRPLLAPVSPEVETRTLDELHKAALAEGADLIVYAGGDLPNAQAAIEQAFKTRFPGMNIRILVDLSKYHDARIDNQLARGKLECDVAHLQTLHDFDRWKAEGHLLLYKPLGWEHVYPDFRDPDGAYVAVNVFCFSNNINTKLVPEAEAPRDALDYLDPKWKGRIVLTYPHDDDAVLYQFDRIISEYGWGYMDRLMTQDVQWIRGTVPARLVVAKGDKVATFTASGLLTTPADSPTKLILPRRDSFLSWPQTGAIFKGARRPEAAKLYMSWLLSKEVQEGRGQWPVRRDVTPPAGFGPVINYNTYTVRFRAFMQDRARIERLKFQMEHYIGPVQGQNPTQVQGLYPVGR
ncbi:MAG: ABC transporter substrate-binding protein [Candidatus Entotheonellia bacterium]